MPLASPDTTTTPAVGEVAAELERGVAAALRGVARADDADPPAVEHVEVAADEQHGRRLRVVAQLHRVGRRRRP